jgi:hypothetical protein
MDPRNRHRHHLSATLLDGRAENGWARLYDAVAIARAAGFRILVMSRIRHATIVPNTAVRTMGLERSDAAFLVAEDN